MNGRPCILLSLTMLLCVAVARAQSPSDHWDEVAKVAVPKIAGTNIDFGTLVILASKASCTMKATFAASNGTSAEAAVAYGWEDKNSDTMIAKGETGISVDVTKMQVGMGMPNPLLKLQIQDGLNLTLSTHTLFSVSTLFFQCRITGKATEKGYELTCFARNGQPIHEVVGSTALKITCDKTGKLLSTTVTNADGSTAVTRYSHHKVKTMWVITSSVQDTTRNGVVVKRVETGTEFDVSAPGMWVRKMTVRETIALGMGQQLVTTQGFTVEGKWKLSLRAAPKSGDRIIVIPGG
jgi:hypothetical protein